MESTISVLRTSNNTEISYKYLKKTHRNFQLPLRENYFKSVFGCDTDEGKMSTLFTEEYGEEYTMSWMEQVKNSL